MRQRPELSFHCHDTRIFFTHESGGFTDGDFGSAGPAWDTYFAIRALMRANGFTFHQDPETKRRWPILAKSHHSGRKGDLRFVAECCNRISTLEFFQEIVTENPNGGRYDFDKLAKMPYLVRLQFLAIRQKVTALLADRGYVDRTQPRPRDAFQRMMQRRNDEQRSFSGESYYEGERAGWRLSCNRVDADGALLEDGGAQVRWFRDRQGYLRRGRVWHNINNMWWVLCSRHELHNIAAFELFTYDPARHPRKLHPRAVAQVQRKLKRAVEAMDFERAIPLRNRLRELVGGEGAAA